MTTMALNAWSRAAGMVRLELKMKKRKSLGGSTSNDRLCPRQLARDFGAGTDVATDAVRTFYEALIAPDDSDARQSVARWKRLVAGACGHQPDRPSTGITYLGKCHGLSPDGLRPAELLFAVQTYYALLVKLLVRQLTGRAVTFEGDPFDWCATIRSKPIKEVVRRLAADLGCYAPDTFCSLPVAEGDSPIFAARKSGQSPSCSSVAAWEDAADGRDLLVDLYQAVFPKRVRHALGEYYTPGWLAEHVLDEAGYQGDPDARLLDPSCGSGTFLVMAINRIRRWHEKNGPVDKGEFCRRILAGVVGYDLHPLAVLSARANYLIALGDLAEHAAGEEIPIYLRDSILGSAEKQVGDCPNFRAAKMGLSPSKISSQPAFDYVVGNPPWIAWDNLPDEYRTATKPLWQQYGLFSLSGSDARHGGGKKDLSMLMLYASADRYLKDGGRLAMVITQTLFQTKGAGDGFRRFRLGDAGPWLRVLRVNDMVALQPFAEAANWTSTILLEKGSPTVYPVPYVKWSPGDRPDFRATGDCPDFRAVKMGLSPSAPPAKSHPYQAEPIDPDRPSSPWFLRPPGLNTPVNRLVGPSDYQAHLGANSGGANGIYWLSVLEEADGGVRVRNIASKGKRAVRTVEQVVEPDLLYPLLRWADVGRYRAVPSAHLLLAQDVNTRKGIDEATMSDRYPRTHAYLGRFRRVLTDRAAYKRYQQEAAFYSMYNVGPYTVAPIKVVWRRMDRRINAAVLEPLDDPLLGRRAVIPQETCVLIALDTIDEAHYLCALLNSSIVGFLVGSHSVQGGKGFGTPSMLDFLRLRRHDPDNPHYADLSAASRQAHQTAARGDDFTEIQHRIDLLAGELWDLSEAEMSVIGGEVMISH